MSIILALGSAIAFGVGDFFGGLASRRTAVTAVIVCSQLVGLAVLVPALALVPGDPDPASVAWGCGAGLAGGVALLLFYRSLAEGSMSVAAPLTALGSAGVPVVVGAALGERASVVALIGIAIAVVAAVLVSAEGGRLPGPRELFTSTSSGGALVAGALFGVFFVLLDQSDPSSGLWPLVGARLGSIVLMIGIGLRARRALRPHRGAVGAIVIAGVCDMGANVLFLLATRSGLLIITAVLVALYPAVTVLLARARLHERAHAIQLVGFAAAALAVTLIALG